MCNPSDELWFLSYNNKAQTTTEKIDKQDFTKIKNVGASKNATKKGKS